MIAFWKKRASKKKTTTALERIAQVVRDLQTVGTLHQEDGVQYEHLIEKGKHVVRLNITLHAPNKRTMDTIGQSMHQVAGMLKEEKNTYSFFHVGTSTILLEIFFPKEYD